MAVPARASQSGNRLPGPQIVSRDHEVHAELCPWVPAEEPSRWPAMVMVITGALSVLAGLLVIIGWHTGHILSPTALRFEAVPVRYNTGLCFIFGGTSLLLLTLGRMAWARAVGAVM